MSESAKKALVFFIYSVLILSVLLVFLQVRNFNFINYDDNVYVYENPHVLSGLSHDGIIWAFTAGHAANWHPMTWLSHMLDCQLFDTNPGWMHLVNVLLHLANTLLLFTVLKKMTGALWQSAFVAAAFALHPMHVESVAWIAERKDVLSIFFLLLTLAAYVSYIRRQTAIRYIGTLVLFAFGLMAKPMLVTLPLLLLLLDYWPLNRFKPQSSKQDGRAILYKLMIEKTPFFVLAAVSSVITLLVQRSGGAIAGIDILPLQSRVANAFLSYARYLGKMFWPENLAVFYPFDAGSIVFLQVTICVLLLLFISILVICFWRTRKYLPVGWFWFVVTLVPVIGFVQVGAQGLADRYTYIPYIGLFIMIAWGLPELLSKWPYRKFVLGISAAVVLTALGICEHRQVSYWNDSITLFSRSIAVTQNNDIAYYNRGVAYDGLGRSAEAIEDFSHAIKIRPDHAEAYNNRGAAYDRFGRGVEAIEDFSQAIKIKPDHAKAHYNRGVAYGKLGRLEEAIEDFREAIKAQPDYVEAYYDRGVTYDRLGRRREAIEDFSQAIKIKPDLAEAHHDLAGDLAGQGKSDEAASQYREALRLKPDWPDCMNNLAFLIATSPRIKGRDTNEAIRLATRACELTNYKDAAFLDTLATAYASAARFGEAVDTAKKALSLTNTANQPQLKDAIGQHLSLYTQGKPCIEPAPNLPPDPNKP
jgi:tetratricopeptide (TPR) repeat protein